MSSRPIMFVPSNFTIVEGATIVIKDCNIIMHDGLNMLHANVFKDTFQGNAYLDGYDIYTQDHPVVFIDKIESYILQEERLV